MSKYLNLVTYFGGKFPYLSWLLPLFPSGNYHFVDMMTGSGNVALNVNYPLITVNDLNQNIINLFSVLRNDFDELLELLYLSPYSKEELEQIIEDEKKGMQFSDIEKARRYYVKCCLGFGANGSQNNHKGVGFEYALQNTKYYRVTNYNNKLYKLPLIVDKLKSFQIENTDVFQLFEKVNKPECITYFDPPYLLSTRKCKKRYKYEWENDLHYKLAELVNNAKSKVAISGIDTILYRDLFKNFNIYKNKITHNNTGKSEIQECLFTNYDVDALNGILKLNF